MQPSEVLTHWQATRLLRESKRRTKLIEVALRDWSSRGWRTRILNFLPFAFVFIALFFKEWIAREPEYWVLGGAAVAGFALDGAYTSRFAMRRVDALVEILKSNGTLDRFEHEIDVNSIPPPDASGVAL